MEINDKLKSAFERKQFSDLNRLKDEISKWSNSIQNSPIKNLGDHITIQEANVKEFYMLNLDTHVELREIQSLTRPFIGTSSPEQTISNKTQVDIWDPKIEIPNDYSLRVMNQIVKGSSRVYNCHKCNASGEITCAHCSGQGKNRCTSCNVMRHPMTDSANIKQTERMNRNTYKTEKPAAHLAHLVLPDTQTNASQNQKS